MTPQQLRRKNLITAWLLVAGVSLLACSIFVFRFTHHATALPPGGAYGQVR